VLTLQIITSLSSCLCLQQIVSVCLPRNSSGIYFSSWRLWARRCALSTQHVIVYCCVYVDDCGTFSLIKHYYTPILQMRKHVRRWWRMKRCRGLWIDFYCMRFGLVSVTVGAKVDAGARRTTIINTCRVIAVNSILCSRVVLWITVFNLHAIWCNISVKNIFF